MRPLAASPKDSQQIADGLNAPVGDSPTAPAADIDEKLLGEIGEGFARVLLWAASAPTPDAGLQRLALSLCAWRAPLCAAIHIEDTRPATPAS